MSRVPFHLAFPVRDLKATRYFYGELLGCPLGRESERWIDFDFFGHQISAHLIDDTQESAAFNEVDGNSIPVRHFGVVLEWSVWTAMAGKLRARGADFLIEPTIRFKGEVGEQGTFFLRDPSGNCLEFKSFKDLSRLFAREA